MGGAGPEASARFFKKYSNLPSTTEVVHISAANTPGKLKTIKGEAMTDFDIYYQQEIELLLKLYPDAIINIVMPCNTAHLRIDAILERIGSDKVHLIDYREVMKDEFKKHEKVALLGTSATVGSEKMYQRFCKKGPDPIETEFIEPSGPEQEAIDEAIFLIKAGSKDDYTRAKRIILEVTTNLRERERKPEMPVFLCCTELPLVFSEKEMGDSNLVCASSRVVERIGATLITAPGSSVKTANIAEGLENRQRL